jgi:hypothetical protein
MAASGARIMAAYSKTMTANSTKVVQRRWKYAMSGPKEYEAFAQLSGLARVSKSI